MKLGRWTTDRLWSPYRSSYASSISVIEKPKAKEESNKESNKDIKKVPFGFARALENS